MKICIGFKRSIWHFPSKCGSLGVESTDIFLLRHHKAAAMKPRISVGKPGCKCKKDGAPTSHFALAKWWLMSVRCITHFNNYVPVI
jgi:hypothetical protein